MPLLGFFGGMSLIAIIKEYDHWIAFSLLTGVALNMTREIFFCEDEKKTQKLGFFTILLLGIATSLDALAVGFSIRCKALLKIFYNYFLYNFLIHLRNF